MNFLGNNSNPIGSYRILLRSLVIAFSKICSWSKANLGADWGSDAFWGDSDVWGDILGNYLYEIKPSRQKCTSIKIRVEDAYPESVASEGLNLNALVFTVGVKEGTDTSQTAVTAN